MPSHKHTRDVLLTLLKAKPKDRTTIISVIPDSEIRSICECCLNVLSENVPLDQKQKRGISRHKKTIRSLGRRIGIITRKRKVLLQSGGGFWLALLPAAISALTSLGWLMASFKKNILTFAASNSRVIADAQEDNVADMENQL